MCFHNDTDQMNAVCCTISRKIDWIKLLHNLISSCQTSSVTNKSWHTILNSFVTLDFCWFNLKKSVFFLAKDMICCDCCWEMHSTTAVNTQFFWHHATSITLFCLRICYCKKFYSQALDILKNIFHSGVCIHACKKKTVSFSILFTFFLSIILRQTNHFCNEYVIQNECLLFSFSQRTITSSFRFSSPPSYCLTLNVKRKKKCNIFQTVHFPLNFVLS